MLTQVVADALATAVLVDEDRAAAELAMTYARAIDRHEPCEECGCDGAGDVTKLGPALLAVLDALLMNPRARAAAKKAVISAQPATNPLDQLAARRAGLGRPPVVDAGA